MMLFHARWTFLLICFIAVCFSGCARRQPTTLDQLSIYRQASVSKPPASDSAQPAGTGVTSLTPFQDIVASLISDSLDLLPAAISGKIFDAILNGIAIPDQNDVIEKTVLSSPRTGDIALLAGFIVQRVYGESVATHTTIPQTIQFVRKERVEYADLAAAQSRLKFSENRALDAYEACLNLLVNSLANNYGIAQKPKGGIYLRDSINNLYFYRGAGNS